MASTTKTLHDVLTGLVWTEKSAAGIEDGTYTFRVASAAHKTHVRQAVEEIWGVKVTDVRIVNVKPKPKRRGKFKGERAGYKKAIVKLAAGQAIQLFEGMGG
jgi:large subunit ribosomal protein L23